MQMRGRRRSNRRGSGWDASRWERRPAGSALEQDLVYRSRTPGNPIFDSASAGDSSSRGDDYEVLHVSGTSGVRSPPDLSGQGQPGVQRSTRGRPVSDLHGMPCCEA